VRCERVLLGLRNEPAPRRILIICLRSNGPLQPRVHVLFDARHDFLLTCCMLLHGFLFAGRCSLQPPVDILRDRIKYFLLACCFANHCFGAFEQEIGLLSVAFVDLRLVEVVMGRNAGVKFLCFHCGEVLNQVRVQLQVFVRIDRIRLDNCYLPFRHVHRQLRILVGARRVRAIESLLRLRHKQVLFLGLGRLLQLLGQVNIDLRNLVEDEWMLLICELKQVLSVVLLRRVEMLARRRLVGLS
jgi:hypothetical protein